MRHDAMPLGSEQPHPLVSQVRKHLLSFLAPLLRTLDHQLDRCLVVTFVETLQALLIWRHRNLGLLLVSSAAIWQLRAMLPPAPNASAICCAPRTGKPI